MKSDELQVPVLIVGAGAGGLSTAALLAKQGVESLVVERRPEVFRYPKARNLSFRTLEILRRLGVGDAVHAVGAGAHSMAVRTSLGGVDEKPGIDVDAVFDGLDHVSPEPPVLYCPQSRLEPILLKYVREQSSRVWYNTGFEEFEQDGTGVSAVVRDLQSSRRIGVRAEYLIAADGVHSPIRTRLGMSTSGYGALPIYVVFIYFRAPWRTVVPHLADGAAIGIENADVSGVFVPADEDLAMFITTYLPARGETAAQFTDERCRELLLAATGQPIDLEIVEVVSWQPYERVADEFRSGRTFLVGDAANAMPPFKAGGANIAIQSADNLAWKLAAVLQHTADAALLDTYHAERHPIGVLSAHQSLTGPPAALLRTDPQRPPPQLDEEVSMFALLVGYQYRSSAVIPSDTEVPGLSEPELVDALRAQPGTRMPHTWVVHRGQRMSTLDLLGQGFTLLTGDDDRQWRAAGRGLDVTVCSIGRNGEAFDLDDAWVTATKLLATQAILVRPDAFVAWRSPVHPRNTGEELRSALAMVSNRPATVEGIRLPSSPEIQ